MNNKIFFNDIFFSISYANYVQQHLQKSEDEHKSIPIHPHLEWTYMYTNEYFFI